MVSKTRNSWTAVAALLAFVLLIAGSASPAAPATQPAATQAPPTAAVATAAVTPAPISAGEGGGSLDGIWEGAVKVMGQEIATRLNFEGQGGTVDFPTQGATRIPMQNFSAQDGSVKFDVLPAPSTASFELKMQGDNLAGSFKQAGYEGTFSATRGVAAQATESAPKEYKEEEVTFKNGDVSLAGTLSLPDGDGPHPAIVLITGSGPQDRDETLFGFKPFAILADALTKSGVAVLRYDDRGVGGSSAGTQEDTSETFAGDVNAAVGFLKARKDIDAEKIGLLGHSEGGIIAPMVAVEQGGIDYIVMLAGPGIRGRELLVEQAAAVAKSSGADDAAVQKTRTEETRVLDAVLTGEGLDEIKSDMVKQVRAQADLLPDDQKKSLGDLDQWAQQTVEQQIGMMQGAWMKFFLTHDQAATLEKVTVPVLALFGEKDVQVPPASNVAPLEAAFAKGGNKDVTVKVIPSANHLFQEATTGSPNEYATLPKEFAPGVVDTITQWVTAQVK